MSIFYGLNTAFKHYTGTAEQAVNMKHINRPQSNNRVFNLYSPADKLLPFQFYLPTDYYLITEDTFVISEWRIVKSHITDPFSGSLSGSDYFDVLAELSSNSLSLNDFIKITYAVNKGVYFIGFMKNLPFPFEMGEGEWYSAIKLADNVCAISEDFTVPCDAGTFFNGDNILKLEWSNTKDVFDIMYQFNNFLEKFVNRVYLIADLVENEPSIIEEGINNDKGVFIPQTITYIDNYSTTEYLPEYLYRAIALAQGHDTVYVYVRGNLISGKMKISDCSIQWGDSGIDGLVTIKMECQPLRKDKFGCASNYTIGSPIPVVANPDYVEVYPKLGNVAINVMANDTGVGLVTLPLINATVGTIQITMNANGSFDITSTGAITWTVYNVNYNIRDFLSNGATGILSIKIVDWIPTWDLLEIPMLFVSWGGRTFNFNTYSLLDNDTYPINVDDVECVSGWYFSVVPGATGNHVIIDSAGHVVYNISNVVAKDRFLITYRNNITFTTKQIFLEIHLI